MIPPRNKMCGRRLAHVVNIHGLIVLPDALLVGQVKLLAMLSVEKRIPTIMDFREFVDNGG
jgi:hypothetical protein